ncbi:MAG: sigma 54-interacting transcriptional regulator [Chloroflexi bacterium]|nr:sigma 54-interacting transcriptional regulator [Chloroflexota bacterium]
MKGVIAMILAGGQGDRLSVLSEERAKPAVIFGGRYRIIDFTLSNCINSDIHRVGVLTQYRPRSLNDHIGSGRPWDLDRTGGGVALLQPYLGHEASDWYQGTADAVYQNLYYVEESRAEQVLLLAGDHVYKMAYDELIAFHRAKGADVTIPVCTVPWDQASRFGTLFLDELGNLPLRLQAKLLRSLQEREVLALGSDKAQSFDVRLLCASNRELEDLILHEQFRLDLYHRIAEFTIKIPPLRERNEDVLHFAALFLAEVSPELKKDTVEIGDAAKPLLLQHAWPGNLRELRNVLRRAALLCPANEIRAEDLALQPVAHSSQPDFRDGHPLKEQVALAAAEIEKDWIRRILQESGGNKAEAARRLGVDYSTLHRKIKKYGLDAMAGLQ